MSGCTWLNDPWGRRSGLIVLLWPKWQAERVSGCPERGMTVDRAPLAPVPNPCHFSHMSVSPRAAFRKATRLRGEWESASEGRAVGMGIQVTVWLLVLLAVILATASPSSVSISFLLKWEQEHLAASLVSLPCMELVLEPFAETTGG